MDNRDIVEQFFYELWMKENLEVIPQVCSEQVILHGLVKNTIGAFGKKQIAESWFSAFPKRDAKIIDVKETKKDIVSVKWSSVSVHEKLFCNLMPTNKEVAYHGTCFYLMRESKIIEYYAASNVIEVLVEEGALPLLFLDEKNTKEKKSPIPNIKINNQFLTLREIDCISLWLHRYSAKQIATKLKLSHRTIEDYLSNIKCKLGIKNSSQLFFVLKEEGLLDCLLNYSNSIDLG